MDHCLSHVFRGGASQIVALAQGVASAVVADQIRVLDRNVGRSLFDASYSRDAERAARHVPYIRGESEALAHIASALAASDPDRAARLFDDAERIAQSITDERSKSETLTNIVEDLAATDPDRAERIAQSITDEAWKAKALVTIATPRATW